MKPNFVEVFLQEADDLLAEIEAVALTITHEQNSDEAINQIFRAFHTIKGSGAMFGFEHVASFTHHIENLIDEVRAHTIPVSEQLATVILAAADQIRLLLSAATGGTAVNKDVQDALLEMVRQMMSGKGVGELEEQHDSRSPNATPVHWCIEFHPSPTLLTDGGNPMLLLRDLRLLGTCVIDGHTDELPALPELNPEHCYLWWTIKLVSACREEDIQDVFIFALHGGELNITTEEVPADSAVIARQNPPVPVAPAFPGAPVPSMPVATTPVATIPVATHKDTSASAPTADTAAALQRTTREATVRVPAERLDRLVNLVGELVMNQARLATAAAEFHAPNLDAPVEEIQRLISELRDDVLQIRMMPIGSIFGRFRRLVHDLSLQLGKQIELVTEGEETELDKSILDQLSEPLVHLLRNSIDHGIETVASRIEAGKPSQGTIRLVATHRGSDVVVSIDDDGGGINKAAVLAKAISKQLISVDSNLSDKEIFNLILLPGFSTAQTISSVSGRGVGMDVVKRQIDALRGSLNITSELGKGTSIALTLPLTLAIIEGLLVATGESQYIIPMPMVMENVELRRRERLLNNGRNIIAIRSELIPYIDLREHFRVTGEIPEISKIVVVRHEDKRVGIVVDRVMGSHQTVIQALGPFFRQIDVVSGSTIMGDGRVALILDIPGIINLANGNTNRERAA